MSTGPMGETCRTCRFWGGNTTESEAERGVLIGWTQYRRWIGTKPDKQSCWKYRVIRRAQLMDEERSRRIEHDTPACSHWQESLVPPQEPEKPVKSEGK